MDGCCLDRNSILRLIELSPPLISGFHDLHTQLQPNGFDLRLAEIEKFDGPGLFGPTDDERILASTSQLSFGYDHTIFLDPGPYRITLSETVHLPLDIMAIGKPRSSFLRSGVAVHNAVWDAGYNGRSQALLVVYHPQGITISRGVRILQLVFFRLEQRLEQGYQGKFQNEGL